MDETEPLKSGDIEETDDGHDGEGDEDGGQILQVITESVKGFGKMRDVLYKYFYGLLSINKTSMVLS